MTFVTQGAVAVGLLPLLLGASSPDRLKFVTARSVWESPAAESRLHVPVALRATAVVLLTPWRGIFVSDASGGVWVVTSKMGELPEFQPAASWK